MIVGAESDGLKVAVLVDDRDDLDPRSLAPVMSDLCREISSQGGIDPETSDVNVVTDGGQPEPLVEAHRRALSAFNGDPDYIPPEIRRELERHGVAPEDLEPTIGGIRGGLWREDIPLVVATILEQVEGRVEIEARPSDEIGHHWQVKWERLEDAPEVVPDGGLPFDEDDIIVRRTRLEPGLGEEDDDDQDLVTDGGVATGSRDESLYLNPISQRTLTRLLALALAIQIPIDLGITAIAWELESNPVVLELGLIPWVGVKLGLLVATILVWYDSRRPSPDPYPINVVTERLPFSDDGRPYPLIAAAWLGIFIGLGLGLIFPNLAILVAEVIA